jgi:hypothetical protein
VFSGVLTDYLSADFQLQVDTVTTTNGMVLSTNNETLKVSIPDSFPYEASMHVTYNATLTNAVVASTQVENSASMLYYSVPTDSSNGNVLSWTTDASMSVMIASPTVMIKFSSTNYP